VNTEEQKKAAALAALDYIKPGMKVGLGTGSTASHFIAALGERVKAGLDVLAVPTSRSTRDLAAKLGIPLTDLEKHPFLDITVDGADEFNEKFELVKGGGGALLLEKIVATSSRYMVVIADESKKVSTLGQFPLAVEVIPFGVRATAWKIERAMKICDVSGSIDLRRKEGKPFKTDSGNAILDLGLGSIPHPARLSELIKSIPGVVETGIFVDICGIILMGTKDGVKTFRKA
jgi:ribose 5-phosphate isomerase A